MPLNKLKKYSELLDIAYMSEKERYVSLRGIFDRDITDNESFSFRGKRIYPIKTDGKLDLDREFAHLTTEEILVEENGRTVNHRVFDIHRSVRLHWIRTHMEENVHDNSSIVIFSTVERDKKARKDVTRTYIYNKTQKYVIVLEPQSKSSAAYFLLTAYCLNREYGEKALNKRYKKRLAIII